MQPSDTRATRRRCSRRALHLRVARRRQHQGRRAQVVPQRVTVAADSHPRLLGLPAAVDRRLRLESCVDSEVVQQAVGLQRHQVGEVASLRLEERPVEQAHVVRAETAKGASSRCWQPVRPPAMPAGTPATRAHAVNVPPPISASKSLRFMPPTVLCRFRARYCLERFGRPLRKTNFWILPVAVFGSSSIGVKLWGTLKCAMRSRQNARSSSATPTAPAGTRRTRAALRPTSRAAFRPRRPRAPRRA